MTAIQLAKVRPEATAVGAAITVPRTLGVSQVSNQLEDIFSSLPTARPFERLNPGIFSEKISSRTKEFHRVIPAFAKARELSLPKTIAERLYDALASFKVRTATIAMHLDRNWRDRLFKQLDSLLSPDDWQAEDDTPTFASFSTFLRMLMFLKPERRPGLGAAGNGHLIASWTVGDERLTMECLPNDIVRWNLSALIDGDRERAAAETPVQRLAAVLAPYSPSRWFSANHVS